MRKGTKKYKDTRIIHASRDEANNTWCGKKTQPKMTTSWPSTTCKQCLKAGGQS